MNVLIKHAIAAGPLGTLSPGQIVDLPDEKAQLYIAAGHAVEASLANVDPRSAAMMAAPKPEPEKASSDATATPPTVIAGAKQGES